MTDMEGLSAGDTAIAGFVSDSGRIFIDLDELVMTVESVGLRMENIVMMDDAAEFPEGFMQGAMATNRALLKRLTEYRESAEGGHDVAGG